MPRYIRILITAAIAVIAAAGVVMPTSRTEAQLLPPPPPVTATFNYDSLGWVVQEIYPSNSVAHNYDSAGNRTSVTLH